MHLNAPGWQQLKHLGPIAQEVLLRRISLSWSTAVVPSVWRRANIIAIPKAGKDPQEVASHHPISLTSHVAKLTERMVGARLTHLLERDNTIPAEQIGFRWGRSAEENLGRLIQEVRDGWNRPRPRGRQDSRQIRADGIRLLEHTTPSTIRCYVSRCTVTSRTAWPRGFTTSCKTAVHAPK